MPPNEIDAERTSGNIVPIAQMRVFVGVKIAPEIASQLARLARELEQAPVKLVAAADIHLTLVPPWNETSISEAVEKLRVTVGRFSEFALTFQHLSYGPQPKRPRLLWVECAASNEITTLRVALLYACGQSDERPFRPHVTLARLRGNGAAIARRHPIDRELSFTQQVEFSRTVPVAASRRKRLPDSRFLATGGQFPPHIKRVISSSLKKRSNASRLRVYSGVIRFPAD